MSYYQTNSNSRKEELMEIVSNSQQNVKTVLSSCENVIDDKTREWVFIDSKRLQQRLETLKNSLPDKASYIKLGITSIQKTLEDLTISEVLRLFLKDNDFIKILASCLIIVECTNNNELKVGLIEIIDSFFAHDQIKSQLQNLINSINGTKKSSIVTPTSRSTSSQSNSRTYIPYSLFELRPQKELKNAISKLKNATLNGRNTDSNFRHLDNVIESLKGDTTINSINFSLISPSFFNESSVKGIVKILQTMPITSIILSQSFQTGSAQLDLQDSYIPAPSRDHRNVIFKQKVEESVSNSIKVLANEVKINQSLKLIDLSYNHIDGASEALAIALETNQSLRTLNLAACTFDYCKEDYDMTQQYITLTSFICWREPRKLDGLLRIVTALKSSKVETLNLSYNAISMKTAEEIISLLENNNAIKSINLSHCKMDSEVKIMLTTKLQGNCDISAQVNLSSIEINCSNDIWGNYAQYSGH